MPTIDPYKLVTNGSLADVAEDHPKTHRPGRNTGERGLHVPRGHPPTLLSDDEVIECRARYEFGRESKRSLCNRYDLDIAYLTRLLNYETRSRLIPRREDFDQLQKD